jgi:DNA (cytosine-5)-methyltransferase 1
MSIKTFGSLCSGIEAASFVFEPLNIHPLWFSEIADFQSRFLSIRYPEITNLGDMNNIPQMIDEGKVEAPDLLCGGTPCQAFSLAGWRNGINDDRGQLTLKYIDIVNSIDRKRLESGKDRTVFFWENVEGALTDKTNAFGCFLAGLLGLEEPINVKKWTTAGVVYGKERNIAWRVMDAKYFNLPQQRRRVYVLGGGKNFHPEDILFEKGGMLVDPFKIETKSKKKAKSEPTLFGTEEEINTTADFVLTKNVNGHNIEAFRSYSDCLYAAYGTKWNGNAAALNGSLFVSQNGRLRRLTPIECERIMGFPDNYTLLPKCRVTQRYKATGNSWATNVVKWITTRLCNYDTLKKVILPKNPSIVNDSYILYSIKDFVSIGNKKYINATDMPYDIETANMLDFIDTNPDEKLYISPAGCDGILRRKYEYNNGMNDRLEIVLKNCSSKYKPQQQ